MKLRLAWLGDPEYADSYSAREARVLLRALARRGDLICLWFAVGSTEPPHSWHGIRVFPIPAECLDSPDFLETLISQQRPQILLSNVPREAYRAGLDRLPPGDLSWLHRPGPSETEFGWAGSASAVLIGDQAAVQQLPRSVYLPHLRGFDPAVRNGADPTTVLRKLEGMLLNGNRQSSNPSGFVRDVPQNTACSGVALSPEAGIASLSTSPGQAGFVSGVAENTACPDVAPSAMPSHQSTNPLTHQSNNPIVHQSNNPSIRGQGVLVMRQQLFCNTSLAQVMFELTNSLIELGVPTVAQDEHLALAKGYVHREEELFRTGAPEKYERVAGSRNQTFDPERAITLHFSLFKEGLRYTHGSVFPSLGGREVLYTTGNHTMTPGDLRRLLDSFERIVAPSWHVLRPYLEAGLPRQLGAVIPHGADPTVYSPQSEPFAYPTYRGFRFLQNSFPWVFEKGWDLTLKAYGLAFSARDDVCLILRVPHIRNQTERASTLGRLEQLVEEERVKAHSPEILLLEADMPLNRRGGIYTGADCYVHPLRAEGFGITILEAMACGLPVIATPWSGPADFLSPVYSYTLRHSNPVEERSKNGTLLRYHVEPDVDNLVYLMRHVYEHHEEAKALGQRASRTAHRDWTWKHAAMKLASAFSPAY